MLNDLTSNINGIGLLRIDLPDKKISDTIPMFFSKPGMIVTLSINFNIELVTLDLKCNIL